MEIIDVLSQIEEELTWRQNEIRFLRNQLSNISAEDDKKRYRKSLVVMLYSHYEGFCRTAFLIYVHQINNLRIKRGEVNEYIKTASLAEVFKAYSNLDKKCKLFKKVLPDDFKLHLYSRQVDFVNMINELWNDTLIIPEDIIDTESNLRPVVLRKMLFRLGFPCDTFSQYEGRIHMLLEYRNNIAHGTKKDGLTETDYYRIESATFTRTTELKKLIIKALQNDAHLKNVY